VARLTNTISPALLNDFVASYVNSSITLRDENGPAARCFSAIPLWISRWFKIRRRRTMQPRAERRSGHGLPAMRDWLHFQQWVRRQNARSRVSGTNAAYGGRGLRSTLLHAVGTHQPTYSARDDIGKALGKHTLQFGAQYVYSQRNQDNNAIGAASGDTQGLLTYNNLAHSTGNAFADFLVEKADSAGNPTGFIQSFTQDSAKHRYYQRYQIAEPYFEDDWKVMHNLTVNLGLRVSLFGTYSEKNRNAWNWEASRFNPTRFAVDPVYGELLDGNAGSTPVPFNPSRFRSTLAW